MDYEDFVKWKDMEANRLVTSLVRLRKHNKTLAQYLFLRLTLFVPAFQETLGVAELPLYPKRGKHKQVLSTKLVQSILKCSERKGWDYARAFNLSNEIDKFSHEYQRNLLSAHYKSDVMRQNNDVGESE